MPDFWDAKWWDAWQAFGTVGATAIAVLLAVLGGIRASVAETALARERKAQAKADRLGVASLVSAWVETSYEVSSSGANYVRRGTVYLANESNEPVFDVHVVIGIGRPIVQIGPLAVPAPIPVLPPRRNRSWDISLALLGRSGGMSLPSDPVARVFFTDSKGVRWERSFDGQLSEQVPDTSAPEPNETEGLKQIGDSSNAFNPIGAALGFMNLISRQEPPVTAAEVAPLLAVNASGWNEFSDL